MGAIIVPAGMPGGPFQVVGLVSGGGGGSPFALIANASASGLSPAITTGAINTTGANLLVMGVAYYTGSAIPTVSDSKGNTWTALTSRGSSDAGAKIFYCVPSSVGAGHTFSVTAGLAIAFGVHAWSGANATPFDVQNGATSNATTSLQTGSVTPSANNSLLVTIGVPGGTSTSYSIDSGFTTTFNQNVASGTSEGAIMSYLTQGTASAINPTISWSGGSVTAAAAIAVFKS